MLTRLAKVRPGDSVLIHGAGGAVGKAIVILGSVMGLELYGTASVSQHDRLSYLGCEPIDYKKEDFVLRMNS